MKPNRQVKRPLTARGIFGAVKQVAHGLGELQGGQQGPEHVHVGFHAREAALVALDPEVGRRVGVDSLHVGRRQQTVDMRLHVAQQAALGPRLVAVRFFGHVAGLVGRLASVKRN